MAVDPEAGISIVCVYNDPEVRSACLDRSIAAYTGSADIDYLPVDNTGHRFTSAGAALNHGARLARNDLVLFVHQDVYLHSIDRILAVGKALAGEAWGIVGASGVLRGGVIVGRMRDRLQFSGMRADRVIDVDSVDEVAFMVRRDRVLAEPLTTDPDLAWHAYAVEYGLRMRRRGLMVGAADLALTHNSLTINLDRFAASHERLATTYADMLPVRTTCGTIEHPRRTWRHTPVVQKHGWRARWVKKSIVAAVARRWLNLPIVLSDIRDDVDLLDFSEDAPLHLINLDRQGGFVDYVGSGRPLTFARYGRPVRMQAVASLGDLVSSLTELPTDASVLVADIELRDLSRIRHRLDPRSAWVVGLQNGAVWLLGGRAARELPAQWSERRAVPLGVGSRS